MIEYKEKIEKIDKRAKKAQEQLTKLIDQLQDYHKKRIGKPLPKYAYRHLEWRIGMLLWDIRTDLDILKGMIEAQEREE